MNDVVLVLKAADAAAKWHVGQRRKGKDQEPYLNHLVEVARLVAEATEGRDPALVAAAFLHDAIEDAGVSRDQIAKDFGEDVAALVVEVTDDKSLPKEVRKQLQIEHAPSKSPRAKVIKLADKTSNIRAITTSPPADWPDERKLAYLEWAHAVVAGLKGENEWLEGRFGEAADALAMSLAYS